MFKSEKSWPSFDVGAERKSSPPQDPVMTPLMPVGVKVAIHHQLDSIIDSLALCRPGDGGQLIELLNDVSLSRQGKFQDP